MSAMPRRKYDGIDIRAVPFPDVIDEWARRTDNFTNFKMLRAFAQHDRYFLLVQILGRKDVLHPWLYERCREVEAEPDGCLDLWAREHYKSTIITYAGIIQEVINNPEITVGIFSHTKSVARKFLAQIKLELQSNVRLKKLFPDILHEDPERDAQRWSLDTGLIVKRRSNPKEATIEAHGLVDGMPTGAHFMLMVYDDVVVPESVTTADQVKKTTEAWEMSDNLGMASSMRKWHIGTRYMYADTYQSIIERGVVKTRIHPATHDGTPDGRPVLLTQKVWDDKKIAQGPATIACQMLQNPIAGQQRMFDVEDLQLYEVRPETLAVYILCDPARSKKKDSDNTAMLVIGLDYAMNKYLLDGFNHKMDLMERWQNLARLYVKWQSSVGVQAVHVGYETFGAQADMDYFKEQQKLHKLRFDIAELAWPREGEGSKIDRVQRLGPDFRSGKFFLPYPTDEKRLTAMQRKMLGGYEYRISKPIKRKDENGQIYDLAEQFKLQVHYFPFGKKDLPDAGSRIYDMEPLPPSYKEQRYAEPQFV